MKAVGEHPIDGRGCADGGIGSPALADTVGPDSGGLRGRDAGHKRDLLERVGIEARQHLESTRTRAMRWEKGRLGWRALMNVLG